MVKKSIETGSNQVTIDSVVTYPVKSLQGIRGEARITDNGLEGDRMFMMASKVVVGGVAARLTLREHPELAQITTECVENGVLLTRPDGDSLVLPFGVDDGEYVEAKLWHGPDKGSVGGLRISDDTDAWLSDFVGEEAQVLAVPDRHRRTMIESKQQADTTMFTGRATDGYPLHIASLASLRRLNESRAENGLPSIGIEHFRANIILDGDSLEPFAEDEWAGIELEGRDRMIRIMSIRACERCVTVEATPFTGEKRRDVLKSLSGLKTERGTSDKLIFGTWAAPSLASVGEVIRENESFTPFQ